VYSVLVVGDEPTPVFVLCNDPDTKVREDYANPDPTLVSVRASLLSSFQVHACNHMGWFTLFLCPFSALLVLFLKIIPREYF